MSNDWGTGWGDAPTYGWETKTRSTEGIGTDETYRYYPQYPQYNIKPDSGPYENEHVWYNPLTGGTGWTGPERGGNE
jgi:hypothetical protein